MRKEVEKMRTIVKTVNVTANTSVIPALERITEMLHNKCVFPRYKAVNVYGTEWETFQELLKFH